MISAINYYTQMQETTLRNKESKLPVKDEGIELKEESIFIRRNKIEHPTVLQIRFERLKRVMRSRSAGII